MNSSINNISAGRELLYQAFQANPDLMRNAAFEAAQAFDNVGKVYHSLYYMPYKNHDICAGSLGSIALNRRRDRLSDVTKIFCAALKVNGDNEKASIQEFVAYKLGTEAEAISNLNLCAPIDHRNPPSLTKFLEKLSQGKFSSAVQKQEKKDKQAEAKRQSHNKAADKKIEKIQSELQVLRTRLATIGELACRPLTNKQKEAAEEMYHNAKYDKVSLRGLSSPSQKLLETFRLALALDGMPISTAAKLEMEFPYSVYANWNNFMNIEQFEALLAAAGFVKIPKGDSYAFALNASNLNVKHLRKEIAKLEDQIVELQAQKTGG